MQLPSVLTTLEFWEMIGTWVIALTIFLEARAMRRQHSTESFWVIVGRLQEVEVRRARRHLLTAFRNGTLRADPSLWPEDVIDAAELTASRFDEIGILVRSNVLDVELLLPSWNNTILRCWEAALPLITHQREHLSDPSRWRDFEALAERARVMPAPAYVGTTLRPPPAIESAPTPAVSPVISRAIP